MSTIAITEMRQMSPSRWRILNALETARQQTKPMVPLGDVFRLDDITALLELEDRALITAWLRDTRLVLADVKLTPTLVRQAQIRITSHGTQMALDTPGNIVVRTLAPLNSHGRQVRHVMHEASVGFEVLAAMNDTGLLEVMEFPELPLVAFTRQGSAEVMVRLTAKGRRYWPGGS